MLILQFIIIQTLVFGAVIYFLKKIMVDNTESAVTRLNESYDDINEKKEELITKIKQIETEYQTKKKEAEEIANKIRDDAEKEMVEKRDTLMTKTRADAEQIISNAMGSKERLRDEIRKEEQLKMLDFCGTLLQKIFTEIVKEKMNTVLINDFLNEMESVDVSCLPKDLDAIEVVSPLPLGAEEEKRIEMIIHEKFKKKLPLKVILDENVLGGISMRFGGLVLDGTLAAKLKESSVALKRTIEGEDY